LTISINIDCCPYFYFLYNEELLAPQQQRALPIRTTSVAIVKLVVYFGLEIKLPPATHTHSHEWGLDRNAVFSAWSEMGQAQEAVCSRREVTDQRAARC